MFKCDQCGESHRRPHRVVVKTRTKVYENVYPKHTKKYNKFTNSFSAIHNEFQQQPQQFAKGWEIVKEENLCDKCYENSTYSKK